MNFRAGACRNVRPPGSATWTWLIHNSWQIMPYHHSLVCLSSSTEIMLEQSFNLEYKAHFTQFNSSSNKRRQKAEWIFEHNKIWFNCHCHVISSNRMQVFPSASGSERWSFDWCWSEDFVSTIYPIFCSRVSMKQSNCSFDKSRRKVEWKVERCELGFSFICSRVWE